MSNPMPFLSLPLLPCSALKYSLNPPFLFLINFLLLTDLCICLCLILAAGYRIFSSDMGTLSCSLWNLVPWLGIKPRPLPWEFRVLAPGKVPPLLYLSSWFSKLLWNVLSYVQPTFMEHLLRAKHISGLGNSKTELTAPLYMLHWRLLKLPSLIYAICCCNMVPGNLVDAMFFSSVALHVIGRKPHFAPVLGSCSFNSSRWSLNMPRVYTAPDIFQASQVT